MRETEKLVTEIFEDILSKLDEDVTTTGLLEGRQGLSLLR
jgi:hypothetical protein